MLEYDRYFVNLGGGGGYVRSFESVDAHAYDVMYNAFTRDAWHILGPLCNSSRFRGELVFSSCVNEMCCGYVETLASTCVDMH